jgi:hypothetical protein
MVTESTAAISHDASALEVEMAELCSDADFSTVYGRDSATFLDTVASRADCLAGGTYAQGGVLCPLQVCGNGMLEIGSLTQIDEECDDGNVINATAAAPAACANLADVVRSASFFILKDELAPGANKAMLKRVLGRLLLVCGGIAPSRRPERCWRRYKGRGGHQTSREDYPPRCSS